MLIGVGLGGFMDGFQKQEEFKLKARQQRNLDNRSAREDLQADREDKEYARAVKQRAEIEGINTGAKAEFDKRVAAGTEKPDNFDTFWSNYALPKLKNTYLTQGNVDMANRVQAWGDSEDAKAGAKLFMSSLSKLQLGDYNGAVDDAFAGAKRKGYLAHGYEFTGKDTLVDPSGKLLGYQFTFKGPDGQDGAKRVRLAELPSFIAGIGNPDAAWQSQIEAQKETAKRTSELEDYRAKKDIDKEYGVGANKGQREDVIKELAKEFDGGLGGEDVKFYDMPKDRQEELIRQRMELRTGSNQPGMNVSGQAAPAASGRKVLMDKVTGQPVNPASLRSPPAQQQPQSAANVPVPQQRPTQGDGAAPAPVDGSASRQDNVTYLLAEAEQALSKGIRPDQIAEALAQNGIPEEAWPAALKAAMANGRRGVITGLGAR